MSSDALAEFRAALADDDLVGALETLDDAERAIEAAADREVATGAVARGVLARSDDPAATETARGFVQATEETETLRLQFGFQLLALTEGDSPPSAILDAVDELIEAQETAAEYASALRETDVVADLPPQVAVVGPEALDVRVGTELAFEVEIENVGTRAIDGVAVGVDADLDLSASPSVASLSPGEATTVTVSGPAASAGEYDVTVGVSGDGVEDFLRVPVVVATRLDYLRRARQQVGELAEDAGDATGDGGSKGNGGSKGLVNQYRTAEKRLSRIIEDVEADRVPAHAVDEKTRAVMELLGAAINHLDAAAGGSLPANEAGLLAHDTGEAIETLARSLSDGTHGDADGRSGGGGAGEGSGGGNADSSGGGRGNGTGN